MAGTVTSATNHYESLGLSPRASDEEIRHAFERKMSAFRWHPIGAASQLCIAYETLRDRIKRADYDRAIGLAPEPQSQSQSQSLRMTMNVMHRHVDPPAPAREVKRRAEAEQPRAGSAIAASLREVARPVASAAPEAPAAAPRLDAGLERQIEEAIAEARRPAIGDDPDDRAFDWKRPAIAVGGFVIAAGLLGALAGFSVKDDAQSAQPEPAVTTRVPAAKPAAAVVEAQPVHVDSRPVAKRTASRRQIVAPAERKAHASAFARTILNDGQSVDAASDQLAAETPAPAAGTAPASMPLPDSVVARTIERIGYACGEVSSTAAVEGAQGVFSVTCSSGQTYRATPVNGRYHFRRAGSH